MKEKLALNSKKYTVVFIVCSLLGILILGGYQTLVVDEENEVEDIIDNDEEQEEFLEEDVVVDLQEETFDDIEQEDVQSEEVVKEDTVISTPQIEETKEEIEEEKEEEKEESVQQEEAEELYEEVDTYLCTIHIYGVNQLLASGEIEVEVGSSAYDVLEGYTSSISMELSSSGMGSSIYIKGINGLNEFDYGGRSGWTYTVNGEYLNTGSGTYIVEDGDNIEWIYTGYE